jgi:hypothetical protein
MDEAQRKGFDAGDGWYVRRGTDGSVSIYVPEPGEKTFAPERWASIVAAVSILGEGHATYRSALGFHGPETLNDSGPDSASVPIL